MQQHSLQAHLLTWNNVSAVQLRLFIEWQHRFSSWHDVQGKFYSWVMQILHYLCLFVGVYSREAEAESTARQLRFCATYSLILSCLHPRFPLSCMSCFDILYLPPYLIMFSLADSLQVCRLQISRRARGEYSTFSGMAGVTLTSSGAENKCSTRSSKCSATWVLSLFLV